MRTRSRSHRSRRSSLVALGLALGASLATSRSARADGTTSPPSLDLRGFHASGDPGSGLSIEPADSSPTGEYAASFWMSYVHRPITLRDPNTNDIAYAVIRNQLTSDFTLQFGVARRLTLGFDLPVLLYQNGDTPTADSIAAIGATSLPKQALGDLGLDGKLTLLRPTNGDFGGFAFALSERFTVPSGDQASYLGEGAVTSETRILGEYRLLAVGVHASAGLKLRGEKEAYACKTAATDFDACPARFGHELPWALGLSFRPQALGLDEKGRWTWFLEGRGYLPVSPIGAFSSQRVAGAFGSLAARYNVVRDVHLLAGVETAFTKGVGNAPFRGTLSVAWAPKNHDVDGDGVEDDLDQCKNIPEDRDGFQDADGCPDMDNDDDGVPDDKDKCPTTKEDEDGFQDEDGCPDPDNDNDHIPDTEDACPNEAGPPNPDPKKNGCPIKDRDGDGIWDQDDKCPDQPEDKDGFQDADGCPDPDNDQDGIPDNEDACPNVKGVPSEDPKRNGCPDDDKDHDTIPDADDKCPNEPETWNGFEDADGCPDTKGKPLVDVAIDKNGDAKVKLAAPLKWNDKNELEDAVKGEVRALAAALLQHPEWKLELAVKPPKKDQDVAALARANALRDELVRFSHRPKSITVASWDDLKKVDKDADRQGWGFHVIGATPPPPKDAQKTDAQKAPKEGAQKQDAQKQGAQKQDAPKLAPPKPQDKPAPKK